MEKIDRNATKEAGDTVTEWLDKIGDKLDEIVDRINEQKAEAKCQPSPKTIEIKATAPNNEIIFDQSGDAPTFRLCDKCKRVVNDGLSFCPGHPEQETAK